MSVLDKIRSSFGRAGTIAGAAALVFTATNPTGLALTIPGTLAVTSAGILFSLRPQRHPVRAAVTALYTAPSVALLGEAITFRVVEPSVLVELAATAAWGAGVWWLRPARIATAMAAQAAPVTAEVVVVEPAPVMAANTPEERLVKFWFEFVACEGGQAPGTQLVRAEVTGPRDFRADIVAPAGQPVPDINLGVLSALTNIPPEMIRIDPVPGCGTGRKALVVSSGPVETGTDIETLWDTHVAQLAMPGAKIVAVRRGSTRTGMMA
ncbi:hypothetical protein [Streptomyces sp. XH2]|uniref:hypothetical protein n=1 Tax=Streptomyces sp. XH2 TaxID=3412483 RepID=UPI003C7D3FAC